MTDPEEDDTMAGRLTVPELPWYEDINELASRVMDATDTIPSGLATHLLMHAQLLDRLGADQAERAEALRHMRDQIVEAVDLWYVYALANRWRPA